MHLFHVDLIAFGCSIARPDISQSNSRHVRFQMCIRDRIMDVLGVTPNELLSGEWKYIDHTEPYIMDVIKREQDFNVSLDYLSENEFFNDEKECRFYMETTLIRYISNYLSSEVVELEELMEIKQLIQRQKLERMMKVHKEMRWGNLYREQPKK